MDDLPIKMPPWTILEAHPGKAAEPSRSLLTHPQYLKIRLFAENDVDRDFNGYVLNGLSPFYH
jgi:hypothetical protein